MAKNKKKKYKPQKKRYPPLSKTDKTIYSVLVAIIFIWSYAFALLRLAWTNQYFLGSENVLASTPSISAFAILPFTIMGIISGAIISEKSIKRRYPIFGNKKVDYYDSKYLFTLPLFDKRYSFSEYKKKMQFSKSFKRNVITFIAVFIITYLFSLFGIFGRTELKTNSIEKFSCLNNLKEQHSYSEVVSYNLGCNRSDWNSVSRMYEPATIVIALTLHNGKTMFFEYKDFNCNPYSIQEVTERLVHAEKHTDDTFLDEFFDEYNFTADEKEVVLNLFSE